MHRIQQLSLRQLFPAGAMVLTSLLMGLGLPGCDLNRPDQNATDKPKVVATSTILKDWTAAVAGDEIELVGLLQPGADPHVYEPVPRDTLQLEQADLILYNGYNLEPGLIKLIRSAAKDNKTFAVGEVIPPLDYDYQGQQEPDPHVWGDADNAIQMVNAIRDQLIALSPEDRQEFSQNAAQYTQQLKNLDHWITVQIQTIPAPQRRLVTTHDAFQYYARAYGLTVTGTLIGISTEEQPSAQTVQRLATAIRQAQVPAIFAETTINPALITTVAQEAQVKLAPQKLYSDSIGAPGSKADTYIKMLVVNTQTIVEALGGNYQNFRADQAN